MIAPFTAGSTPSLANRSPLDPMTKAQEKLYWREWVRSRKADPQADRHAIQKRALGVDDHVPTKFSNRQFDLVLAAFRAISRPASIEPQIRAQAQPAHRQQHRIHEIQRCLALSTWRTSRAISRRSPRTDSVCPKGAFSLDDLSDQETVPDQLADEEEPETVPSQLDNCS